MRHKHTKGSDATRRRPLGGRDFTLGTNHNTHVTKIYWKTKPVMMLLIILWMFCLGMLGMGFHVHSDRGTEFYAALAVFVCIPTFFSVMTALVIFFPLRFFLMDSSGVRTSL